MIPLVPFNQRWQVNTNDRFVVYANGLDLPVDGILHADRKERGIYTTDDPELLQKLCLQASVKGIDLRGRILAYASSIKEFKQICENLNAYDLAASIAEKYETNRWYSVAQNNSGGRFIDPALYLLTPASSRKEAKENLSSIIDLEEIACDCCGPRWSPIHTSKSPYRYVIGLIGDAILHYAINGLHDHVPVIGYYLPDKDEVVRFPFH